MHPEIAALADALAQALAGRPAHERIAALARAAAIPERPRTAHARIACPLPAAAFATDASDDAPTPTAEDAGSLLIGLSLRDEDPYVDIRLDPSGALPDPTGEVSITRRPGLFDVDVFDRQGEHVLGITLADSGQVHLRP
jgi:hypothetical protein